MQLFNFKEYEDIIELNIVLDCPIQLDMLNWVRYNPRKDINRWGCSITSLDGKNTGIPDLDSLFEFNRLNNTKFRESDFKTLTEHSTPFETFLKTFTCGRSHYLKLGNGGYFPWHRDNDINSFRIIYTVQNCEPGNMIWLEDDKILNLQDGKWYYINTKKKHCLFAFNDAIFSVFNVVNSQKNISNLFSLAKIK